MLPLTAGTCVQECRGPTTLHGVRAVPGGNAGGRDHTATLHAFPGASGPAFDGAGQGDAYLRSVCGV